MTNSILQFTNVLFAVWIVAFVQFVVLPAIATILLGALALHTLGKQQH